MAITRPFWSVCVCVALKNHWEPVDICLLFQGAIDTLEGIAQRKHFPRCRHRTWGAKVAYLLSMTLTLNLAPR